MKQDVRVVTFYRFRRLPQYERMKEPVLAVARECNLLGTVLLAPEGINATLAGSRGGLDRFLRRLGEAFPALSHLTGYWSSAGTAPFRRLRVRLREEIVSMGQPDVDVEHNAGERLSATDWNRLISDPATLLIDTRNRYEIEVGQFPGAVNPGTSSFREFPAFIARSLMTERDRPIAMYCTGGIRCEKASAYLKERGFENVYQLEGGILSYLGDLAGTPEDRWQGECFVFDGRVTVDPQLAPGHYVQCHACRRPLSSADIASPLYREGVSCPRCHGEIDAERAGRLEERRRQVRLAERRGQRHIGAVYESAEDDRDSGVEIRD